MAVVAGWAPVAVTRPAEAAETTTTALKITRKIRTNHPLLPRKALKKRTHYPCTTSRRSDQYSTSAGSSRLVAIRDAEDPLRVAGVDLPPAFLGDLRPVKETDPRPCPAHPGARCRPPP